MILVRNPNYDQSTDPYRKNYPDEFNFVIDSNADDIFNKIAGRPVRRRESRARRRRSLRQYATTASLKPQLLPNVGDRTWYLTMNLTQPPFDDIHVRKAMNLIIDKAALRRPGAARSAGSIATTSSRPLLYNGGLADYDPYATPGEHGTVAKAKAAMKGSKYDPGKTGMCTASACKGVLMVADTRVVDNRHGPVIQAGREEDRHHLHGALDQRRLPDDPDAGEERPDRRAPGLG